MEVVQEDGHGDHVLYGCQSIRDRCMHWRLPSGLKGQKTMPLVLIQNNPKRVIAALELLATLVAVKMWGEKGRKEMRV